MTVLTCAQVRELAPELALGVLGGAERAEAIAHVNECARCQALVLELTEAADALPLLAPEAEPPAGFEHRVLARIHAGRRRSRRRFVAAVAAVAAAVAILSITVVRVVETGEAAPSAVPVAVQMRDTVGDTAAGWAYVSNGSGVAVMVDYGVADGHYRVRLGAPDVRPVTLGTITIAGGRGTWTGQSREPVQKGSTIALVDGSGRKRCQGTVA